MNPLVPGAQDSAGSWCLPFPISSFIATDKQRAETDQLLPSGLGLTSELGEKLPALAGTRGPEACWGGGGSRAICRAPAGLSICHGTSRSSAWPVTAALLAALREWLGANDVAEQYSLPWNRHKAAPRLEALPSPDTAAPGWPRPSASLGHADGQKTRQGRPDTGARGTERNSGPDHLVTGSQGRPSG